MSDEESREVAEAVAAVQSCIGDRFDHECVIELVEAVRKDERERVLAEMKEAATLKIGPGDSISGGSTWTRHAPSIVEGWIEGRSPLEERIRELEAIAFHTDGVMHAATEHIKALEEERDRRLVQLDSLDTWRMNAIRGIEWRARAEAAEAQVAKLREALGHIQKRIDVQGPTGVPLLIEISAHIRRVLAETVQEGGE